MVVANGDDLSNQLMNAKGFCPNCGASLTFEESARLAKSNGVSENAVMCPDCRKVFNVNLAPNKMTILNEIKKYNFSSNNNAQKVTAAPSNNTQQVTSVPDDFEKRVSRDKKIIIGAIAAVVILIIIGFVTIPSMSFVGNIGSSYDSLDNYNDISASSKYNLRVTDAYQDSTGWCFVYGKVTPKSSKLSDYKTVVIFYDDFDNVIGSDFEYLINDNSGEFTFAATNLDDKEVDHVEVGLIDDDNNLVDKDTYYAI